MILNWYCFWLIVLLINEIWRCLCNVFWLKIEFNWIIGVWLINLLFVKKLLEKISKYFFGFCFYLLIELKILICKLLFNIFFNFLEINFFILVLMGLISVIWWIIGVVMYFLSFIWK